MARKILYHQDAREKLKAGVDALANAVGATIGPLGDNVAIKNPVTGTFITRDGVTVARDIELKDTFENMGVELVLEAATKTNDAAGDGTTTATVLAQALVTFGLEAIRNGRNRLDITKEIQGQLKLVVDYIKSISRDVSTHEEVQKIATNSCQDEVLGAIVADAIKAVGETGIVTVGESGQVETNVEIKAGMNFPNGYYSPHFINNDAKETCEIESARILIIDGQINVARELFETLESNLKAMGTRNIVIIAHDIDPQSLSTLLLNKMGGSLNVSFVKAPDVGVFRLNALDDIALLTGGKVVSPASGHKLSDITPEFFGTAAKVISARDDTTIIDGGGDKVKLKERIEQLKELIKNAHGYELDKLSERLAKLASGIAVIKVGGITQIEVDEKKYRVEDAINAAQSALSEGIVIGGGMAFLNSRKIIKDGILSKALEAPFRKILTNANLDPEDYLISLETATSSELGVNALTGIAGNMFEAGIVDPTKVVRSSLENAVSVACNIISTDVLIADEEESE